MGIPVNLDLFVLSMFHEVLLHDQSFFLLFYLAEHMVLLLRVFSSQLIDHIEQVAVLEAAS